MVLRDVGGPHGVEQLATCPHTAAALRSWPARGRWRIGFGVAVAGATMWLKD